MMRKLIHHTAVAAGFAALLLTGACASHNAVATEPTDEVVQVTQTETTVTTPEMATVDSQGNVVAESTVTVTNSPLVEPGTMPDTTGTALTTTTTTTQTTTVAAPELTPMTSSSNLDTQTTTTTDDTTATTETETRTRLRKD